MPAFNTTKMIPHRMARVVLRRNNSADETKQQTTLTPQTRNNNGADGAATALEKDNTASNRTDGTKARIIAGAGDFFFGNGGGWPFSVSSSMI